MNEQIFHYLNGFAGQSPFFDRAVIFSADQLPWFLLGGLLVFLAMHKDKRKGARDLVVVVTAALVAWAVALLIKHFYLHPRPSMLLGTHVLFTPEDIQSFPSGHATFFAALPAALYFYHKKIALLYALGALFIGLARIIGGVHWPLDILGGYILGGIIGASVYYSYNRFSSGASTQQ